MSTIFEVKENGAVDGSKHGHYTLFVVDREEETYPNKPIKRYEIVNNYTGACEGRIAHMPMALIVMNEFDRRLQDIIENGIPDPEDETVGTPVAMDLGSTPH